MPNVVLVASWSLHDLVSLLDSHRGSSFLGDKSHLKHEKRGDSGVKEEQISEEKGFKIFAFQFSSKGLWRLVWE